MENKAEITGGTIVAARVGERDTAEVLLPSVEKVLASLSLLPKG